MFSCSFFFFQAEDGIRDKLVTGVQTCALPISALRRAGAARRPPSAQAVQRCERSAELLCRDAGGGSAARADLLRRQSAQIGRASCRGRGEISVVAGSLKKKKQREGYATSSETD